MSGWDEDGTTMCYYGGSLGGVDVPNCEGVKLVGMKYCAQHELLFRAYNDVGSNEVTDGVAIGWEQNINAKK